MKIATYSVVVVEILCLFFVSPQLPRIFMITGAILGFAGDILFAVSVITMKDSWRAGIAENDKTEMITGGIYSVSRNPAFWPSIVFMPAYCLCSFIGCCWYFLPLL